MRLPSTGRWPQRLALIYGAALFLWFSVEDNTVWPVTLFGLGLAMLIMGLTTLGKIGQKVIPVRALLPLAAWFGGLTGLGTSIATAGLMFFKNALHAHVFLDFPPGLMLAILERAPVWGAVGMLVGCGLGLGCWAFHVE